MAICKYFCKSENNLRSRIGVCISKLWNIKAIILHTALQNEHVVICFLIEIDKNI